MHSLREIKDSKFDGLEICLWEDMNSCSGEIKEALDSIGLKSNVHGDLMGKEDDISMCALKFAYGIEFKKRIGALHFISHPIKPYLQRLAESRKIFGESKDRFLIESVRGISYEDLMSFGRPIVLDIGNVIKNRDYKRISQYQNVEWLHVHDYKDGEDHLPLGEGEVDLKNLIKLFPERGFTIELGKKFRRWQDLKESYQQSIDLLNNLLISNKSFGKNVRLKHLKRLIGQRKFFKTIELGCKEGYLLHNLEAEKKIGIDICPERVFNDIQYITGDLADISEGEADLVVCSEVIEHFIEDNKAIERIAAMLRENGLVFLSTLNKNTSADKSSLDRARGHLRRYDTGLEQMIRDQGFVTLAFYPFRSSHYYQQKGNFDSYNPEIDIRLGNQEASGWIYFGFKK